MAIEASELRKAYAGVTALDGLSLAVEPGTIFGLLGPNGAGKSTTVRVLSTLTRPDGGSARVAGIDVLREPVKVRHAIGVVGQRHGTDPEATGRLTAWSRPTRAGCAAASISPWACCTGRRSCSSTSPPPASTRRRAPASGARSSGWPPRS